MFSFRTTKLSEQLDKALVDGKVIFFCTPNCWDTQTQSYNHEQFSRSGRLEALIQPGGEEFALSCNKTCFDPELLKKANAIVVEIQDGGSRYFPHTQDVYRLMDTLHAMDDGSEYPALPSMYVVDHYNPAGRIVEGTIPVVDYDTPGPRVPHRHGLSLGELCHMHYSEIGARFPLHIISAETSSTDIMPWTIAPSADLPGLFSCQLYSGGALWTETSITPGLGTPRPYEYFGAPFIHPHSDKLPTAEGMHLRPCSFTPAFGQYSHETCFGHQIILEPGAQYHSLLHTIRLIRYYLDNYTGFKLSDGFVKIISDPVIMEFIRGNITFDIVQEHVKAEEQKWIRKAKRFSLYEDQPIRIK